MDYAAYARLADRVVELHALVKAKRADVNERRKRKDGWYVKQLDGSWEKEKAERGLIRRRAESEEYHAAVRHSTLAPKPTALEFAIYSQQSPDLRDAIPLDEFTGTMRAHPGSPTAGAAALVQLAESRGLRRKGRKWVKAGTASTPRRRAAGGGSRTYRLTYRNRFGELTETSDDLAELVALHRELGRYSDFHSFKLHSSREAGPWRRMKIPSAAPAVTLSPAPPPPPAPVAPPSREAQLGASLVAARDLPWDHDQRIDAEGSARDHLAQMVREAVDQGAAPGDAWSKVHATLRADGHDALADHAWDNQTALSRAAVAHHERRKTAQRATQAQQAQVQHGEAYTSAVEALKRAERDRRKLTATNSTQLDRLYANRKVKSLRQTVRDMELKKAKRARAKRGD